MCRTATCLMFSALVGFLVAAWGNSPVAAAQPRGQMSRRAVGVHTVYLMNYQGPYDYGLSEVPRFRWGYFGTHTRPTTSWYRGYSRDFRQWTFQPGN